MDTPDTLPPVVGQKSDHPYATLTTPERLKILSTTDGLAGPNWDGTKAVIETDYVSQGGRKLNDFIRQDRIMSRRFKDAACLFLQAEEEAKIAIEREIEIQGLGDYKQLEVG